LIAPDVRLRARSCANCCEVLVREYKNARRIHIILDNDSIHHSQQKVSHPIQSQMKVASFVNDSQESARPRRLTSSTQS